MEACGGVHFRARRLQVRGHNVRLMATPVAPGAARYSQTLLERRTVVSVLFRFKLRRGADSIVRQYIKQQQTPH